MPSVLRLMVRCDSWCKLHLTDRQTAGRDIRRTVSGPLLPAAQGQQHWSRVDDTASTADARGMRMNAETLSSRHCPAPSFPDPHSHSFLVRDEKTWTAAGRTYDRRGSPTERALCQPQRYGRKSNSCDSLD